MHNHHMDPARIRASLRRTLDPCRILSAKIQRDGQTICEAEVWRYQKSSLAASLSMALSGVLAGDAAIDRAMVLQTRPAGAAIQPEDELALPDGTALRIVACAPWPAYGPPASTTLTLRGAN